MRTQKQLCKTDPGLSSVGGMPVSANPGDRGTAGVSRRLFDYNRLSEPGLPAGFALFSRIVSGALWLFAALCRGGLGQRRNARHQSLCQHDAIARILRVIETQIDPRYNAKNDTLEFNVDYNVTPALTFTSQTGYNQDFLYSTEDYNRFNTTPDIFIIRALVNAARIR